MARAFGAPRGAQARGICSAGSAPSANVQRAWVASVSRRDDAAAATSCSQPIALPSRQLRCRGAVNMLLVGGHCSAQRIIRCRDAAEGAAAAAAAVAGDDGDGARQWEREIEELMRLVTLLPASVREAVESRPDLSDMLEVVLDLGRPPIARFPAGDVRLSDAPVTAEDIEAAVGRVGAFGGDNRAGIDRTLHRISCMRSRSGRIIGLTCRVGRSISGSAKMVEDLVLSGASILLLGRPGVGKTTAIREVSRMLADDLRKRVVIVDTSNEIGGDGDIPHEGIGRARRMQVADPDVQHKVMIEAVENHMPEVIVIDEIGSEAECAAAKTIAQRGVQLVATAHGNELENLIKNPSLSDLIGGIQSVTLGDEEAKRRGVQKSILERAGPPTFDVAIEMLERNRWRVHADVAAAVDNILAGGSAGGQTRERLPDGSIAKYTQAPSVPGAVRSASSGGSSSSRIPADLLNGRPELPPGDGRAASPTSAFFMRSVTNPGGEGLAEGSRDEDDYDEGRRESVKSKNRRYADPATALLRLYCMDLDEDVLWSVMTGLGVHDKVWLCNKVSQADAVLALRSRLKASATVRAQARDAGVPIYAIKSSSAPNLVRAFRTLLGTDPSSGGAPGSRAFGGGSLDGLDAGSEDDEGDAPGGYSPSAKDVAASGGVVSVAKAPYSSTAEGEALEEARLAAETIVLPLAQPAELLPRGEAVLRAQVKLVERYGLGYELLGAGSSDARLRILPKEYDADATAPSKAPVSSIAN